MQFFAARVLATVGYLGRDDAGAARAGGDAGCGSLSGDALRAACTAAASDVESIVGDQARFSAAVESLSRSWASAHLAPAAHASALRLLALQRVGWMLDDRRDALLGGTASAASAAAPAGAGSAGEAAEAADEPSAASLSAAVTAADLRAFGRAFFAAAHAELLLLGNVSAEGALQIAAVARKLALPGDEAVGPGIEQTGAESPAHAAACRIQVTELPPGADLRVVRPALDPAEENNVCEVYYQAGAMTPRLRAGALLLEAALSELFFDELRTQQALGYSVSLTLRNTSGVVGFAARIVSRSHSAAALDRRIDAFFVAQRPLLAGLSDADFAALVAAAVELLSQRDANAGEEAERHWAEISLGRCDFAATAAEVAALQTATLADVLALYDAVLLPAGWNAKAAVGKGSGNASGASGGKPGGRAKPSSAVAGAGSHADGAPGGRRKLSIHILGRSAQKVQNGVSLPTGVAIVKGNICAWRSSMPHVAVSWPMGDLTATSAE